MENHNRSSNGRRRGFEAVMMEFMCNMNNNLNNTNPPPYRQNSFERFSRQRPPIYSGTENPTDLDEWFEEMEKLLQLCEIPEKDMVNVVAYFLKGEANSWWQLIKANQVNQPDFNWEKFKTVVENKFTPPEMKWRKQEEFNNLQMGNLTLSQYTKRYIELSRYGRALVPTEQELANRHIRRMEPKLKQLMPHKTYANYQ